MFQFVHDVSIFKLCFVYSAVNWQATNSPVMGYPQVPSSKFDK